MLSYDENSDGMVTRAELEAGLRRQFATVDVNHDGRLNRDEYQAENSRRQMANGTGYSPLIDWNQDGFIDFDEFATTARSVFDELDKNHDGVLSSDELRLPSGRGAGGAPGGAAGRGGRSGRRGP
jgi:Ca2+-binding EF-hand superfamily protein